MPTPGQILKALEGHLKNRMRINKEELAEWAEKIVHPKSYHTAAHQFEWCDGEMYRAALIRVYGRVLDQLLQMPKSTHPTQPLTTDERLAKIEYMLHEGMVWKARHPSHSTSQGHNLIHVYETQVWTELYETVKDPWSLDGLW